MKDILIEGVDRLGKDTLITGLKNRLGFFQTVHYQKPEMLDCLLSDARKQLGLGDDSASAEASIHALRQYQQHSFINMFKMLSSDGKFIMNRAHLGEFVYAPRYRKYDGSYIFELEKSFIHDRGSHFHQTTLLVLLHTSSWDFIEDDGQSFDFDKKDEEQMDFVRAFERSEIIHKLMLDVNDGAGGFVPKEKLLEAVIHAYLELPAMIHPTLNVWWTRDESGELTRHNLLQPDPKKLVS